jgi:hypothetical protein
MVEILQIGARDRVEEITRPAMDVRPFFSIRDLAERWRCSRASVYNQIRGEKVLDFATNGRKGHKVVPLEVVLKIERAHLRVLR